MTSSLILLKYTTAPSPPVIIFPSHLHIQSEVVVVTEMRERGFLSGFPIFKFMIRPGFLPLWLFIIQRKRGIK